MAMKAEKWLDSMRFTVYRRPLISSRIWMSRRMTRHSQTGGKRGYITISYDIILLILLCSICHPTKLCGMNMGYDGFYHLSLYPCEKAAENGVFGGCFRRCFHHTPTPGPRRFRLSRQAFTVSSRHAQVWFLELRGAGYLNLLLFPQSWHPSAPGGS
jgi:hypothetical protein